MDFSCFINVKIIDGHVHFVHPERMDEILVLMDEVPCAQANLVCIPNPDASTHNPAALFFKERYPERVFISAALEYAEAFADPLRAPEILGGQIATLKARGFQGLKLIEGKPEVRKLLPHPLDGPLYVEVWQALEREGIPVIFHVADPDEFWDPKACPEWARQSGWDYSDGSYPSKEDLYTEVEHILTRHPRLKIIFAHFYFLSGDLERAARFLELHPSVCFDLAPHMGMYQDFSAQPETARDFFLRFQDRIIYGTDMDTRVLLRGSDGYRFMQFIAYLIRSILERDGVFLMPNGNQYVGLGLPLDALVKIYSTNFMRMFGPG